MALNNNPTPNEVVKAIKDLENNKENKPVHITTAVDFNNMTTEGVYCIEIANSTNTPVNAEGVLRVYKVDANRILQIFNTVTFDTSDEEGNYLKMYMRNYTLAVDEDYYNWDTWRRIVDDIYLDDTKSYIQDWVQDTFARKSDTIEKTTSSYKIYGTDNSGNNTFLKYSAGVSNLAIPQRTSTGQIQVPTTPTVNEHATSKLYVDNINSMGLLTDFNSTAPLGNKGHILTYMYNNNTANRPSGCYSDYGVVMYINGDTTSGTEDWTRQILLPNYLSYGRFMYHRQYINGSWGEWSAFTTKIQDLLLSTNTNGTYTVANMKEFKYIIMAHKDSWGNGEWMTSIYPTSRLENNQEFTLENGNHNTWSKLTIVGTPGTSVKLEGNNRQWFQLNGVS